MKQWGFYVGDQWKVQPNLTLTLGGRVDMPRFSDRPLANPVAVALFGYATDVVPSPTQFSPRFGFNWDVMKDGRNQVPPQRRSLATIRCLGTRTIPP